MARRPFDSAWSILSRIALSRSAVSLPSLTKEAIGGYFLLNVATMDEAVAIARQCPGLAYGAKVEVRAVGAECPLAREALPESQPAAATA